MYPETQDDAIVYAPDGSESGSTGGARVPTIAEFAEWLQHQLDERGWNAAELTKRGGVVHTQIVKIMNKTSRGGITTLAGIATALDLSLDEVARQAGYLPPLPPATRARRALMDIVSRLEDDDVYALLRVVRGLAPPVVRSGDQGNKPSTPTGDPQKDEAIAWLLDNLVELKLRSPAAYEAYLRSLPPAPPDEEDTPPDGPSDSQT